MIGKEAGITALAPRDAAPPPAPEGLAHPGLHAAADFALSEATRAALTEAVPASTRGAYAADMAAFTAWCAGQGRTALPATAETVTE
ncbi:hypothetical protein OHA77_39825 [Streptosporangium sp. NBC_01639]|uniref:hypothetical protein n=1 Tax=Streptosporangium sp. NBC_01639 TaxID=2975948 RepID=UPI0038709213|nr:hypothetical protein OHA77_39825 [Streptosporangium sp. NBC_01639]